MGGSALEREREIMERSDAEHMFIALVVFTSVFRI
jgi:hypothetical protein